MPTGEIYFRHSLRVNDYLCQGCTTCMRTCPTAAIRIRGGKAVGQVRMQVVQPWHR